MGDPRRLVTTTRRSGDGARWLEEAPGPWRRRSGTTPALRATAPGPLTSEEAAARAAARS